MFTSNKKRSALVLLCLGAPVISTTAAQDSPTKLDSVVISATRSAMSASALINDVTVIDRDTIERSAGRSLVELLALAAGVQFTSNGGLGKSSALFIRGLEARHVLLLIDGVRVGSATLNTPSLDNLPLDLIDRIEIVRGPMSSLYGSNALAGVVQVFTRQAVHGLQRNAKVTLGSHGYRLLGAGVSSGTKNFQLAVQAQHQRNDGFSATNARAPFGNFNPDNDGFRQNAASIKAGWRLSPQWRLEGLWLESQGNTQYDDGLGVDARAALLNRVQSLQASGQVNEAWHTQVALGRALDQYDTRSSASAFATLGVIETDQRQATWENQWPLPLGLGQLLLALERIEQQVGRSGAPYLISERYINAAALGWTAQLDAHDLQASLRQDRNSQFGQHTTGALAYAYRFNSRWRTGGSYGTSFTAPSFNQLYYPGFGNPNLPPEEGQHGELFVQWARAEQRWRATLYQHRYDLFIASGPQPTNIPRVKIGGGSLSWAQRLDAWQLQASYDVVEPRNDSAGDINRGKLLPRRAQQAAKASVAWHHSAYQLGAALQTYTQRYDDSANRRRLAGFALLDLYAECSLAAAWQVGLRLNNLTHKAYETAYGYNQPGREGFISLRWREQ